MRRVGIGYRRQLHDWLVSDSARVDCLEVTAEHFFDDRSDALKQLAGRFPIYVHGLGLSLGTPGPLDKKILRQFAKVAEAAKADWVSEHVAFSRTEHVDLGHLNPVPTTRQSLAVLVDHAQQVAAYCQRPILLENITCDLRIGGELSECEFLNQLCDSAGCGLLLDVTNLFINSQNHQFDPAEWLREIEPDYIRQLHIVGYSHADGVYRDYHAAPLQDDLLELLQLVLEYSNVKSIILERDERLEDTSEIAAEVAKLRSFSHL